VIPKPNREEKEAKMPKPSCPEPDSFLVKEILQQSPNDD